MIDHLIDVLFGKACKVVVVHTSGTTAPCNRRDHATAAPICRHHLNLISGKVQ